MAVGIGIPVPDFGASVKVTQDVSNRCPTENHRQGGATMREMFWQYHFFAQAHSIIILDRIFEIFVQKDKYPRLIFRPGGNAMIRRMFFLWLVIFVLLPGGCSRQGEQGGVKEEGTSIEGISGRKILVATTIGMIKDIVENVGGSRVRVTGLMGPGVDPHLYKASEGDVARMAEADMIFYNGLHLEGKMTDIFEKMGRFAQTIAVTDGIERSLLMAPPEFKGAHDPHVWFDVSLWMKAATHVRGALIKVDPENEAIYRKNTEDYLRQLDELHKYVIASSGKLPKDKRVLITAHDAFNYFGRAYGFEVKGLQGISTVAEAGIGDIQSLVAFIVERKIPAVFVETSVPRRYIEALRESVRARGFDVMIGGNLFSDAMGNPGTPEGTYIGMVRHNIDTIVAALLQKIPEPEK
jgi:manganese/zinc/iron transport system substrate-binding protein